MALPWLESIPVWGRPVDAAPPKRFAALFMANGINYKHWWAKGAGAQMELGKCLQPLEPVKAKTNVIAFAARSPSAAVNTAANARSRRRATTALCARSVNASASGSKSSARGASAKTFPMILAAGPSERWIA